MRRPWCVNMITIGRFGEGNEVARPQLGIVSQRWPVSHLDGTKAEWVFGLLAR